MSVRNLPIEIQRNILDHLNTRDLIECSLVSKQWRHAAKHALFEEIHINCCKKTKAFIDTLVNSPHMGELVKKLVLHNFTNRDGIWQYSKLIHLTPNLKVLKTNYKLDVLYQVLSQEMKNGHWKYLHLMEDNAENDKRTKHLSQDYYVLASIMQDRISTIMLDISLLFGWPENAACFQYPLHITKETRFKAAKRLICITHQFTYIEFLDDALALCPGVTSVKVENCHLKNYESKMLPVEPSATVKVLDISLCELTEVNVNYICHKFTGVKELTLLISNGLSGSVDILPSSLEVSKKILAQLIDYAHSTEKFCIGVDYDENLMQLFLAIISLQWQGKMTINWLYDRLYVKHDRSKPKHSALSILSNNHSLVLTQAKAKAYFNQVDKLETYVLGPGYDDFLTHFEQLQSLEIHSLDTGNYEGPILPVTQLTLEDLDTNTNFVKQICLCTPNLKDATLVFHSLDAMEIDMSSVSFHSLNISNGVFTYDECLYIHLVRSGKETYYRLSDGHFCEIKTSGRNGRKPMMDGAKLKIICKDIQQLKISWSWNPDVEMMFPPSF